MRCDQILIELFNLIITRSFRLIHSNSRFVMLFYLCEFKFMADNNTAASFYDQRRADNACTRECCDENSGRCRINLANKI